MPKKKPLDKVIEELSELVSKIDQNRDNLKEGKPLEGVDDWVKDVRNHVKAFKESTEEMIRKAGKDPKDLLDPSSWKKDLPARDRKTMESLEGLKRELRQRKDVLAKQIAEEQAGGSPAEKKKETPKKKAKKKRMRKKKFRGLGGDDWVKM